MKALLLAFSVALLFSSQLASAAENAVTVGKLVAQGKLSPRIEFQRKGQELYADIKLENITSETLPGWELTTVNAYVAGVYRITPDGQSVLIERSQWNFITPASAGAPKMRDAPNAPLPPGACSMGRIVITLNGKAGPNERIPNNITQSGLYRVIFTMAKSGRVLGQRDFEVIGATPEKLHFARLGSNSTPHSAPR